MKLTVGKPPECLRLVTYITGSDILANVLGQLGPLWRGRMASVWKFIHTLVSTLQYHAPILYYSICLYGKQGQPTTF
jgi:hypothetical protein